MFRSEKLNYYKVVAPRENGRELIIRLAEKKGLHLVDLNQQELGTKKFFHPQIRQIEEIIIALHHIQSLVASSRTDLPKHLYNESMIDDHFEKIDRIVFNGGLNEKTYLHFLEEKAQQTLKNLKSHSEAKEHLIQMIHKSEEELMVLRILKLQLPDSFK
jgi:hypothetical protein